MSDAAVTTESQFIAPSERFSIRFGATLIANVLRAGLSFATGLLIARTLGAVGYGNLNFLLSSFLAFTFLLDMGSTPAFYTFISQRKRPPLFFVIYIGWTVGIQFLMMMLVIAAVLPDRTLTTIWLGQPRMMILLACAASFAMSQVWLTVSQMGEATRKTLIVQAVAVVQAIVHLLAVIVLARLSLLTVSIVLWLLIAEFGLAAIFVGPMLLRSNLTAARDDPEPARDIIRQFAVYCAPLVIYGWINSLYSFANRWLLQRFGGSVQQGYFSVGQQFAAIGLIATTSILNVFWKEIAEARQRGDQEALRLLYTRARRSLYCFAALVSCFLIPYSREIVALFVGNEYAAGWPVLAVMFLYPIHQSLGQLLATFFYATAETRAYTSFGIAMMLSSIPIVYLVLAPPTSRIPGLGLGALGLAAAMVVLQIGSITVQSWWVARVHGWPGDTLFQLVVAVLFIGIAFVSRWIAAAMTGTVRTASLRMILMIIAGGVVYMAVALLAVFRFPSLGFDRGLVRQIMRRFGIGARVA